ncbi:hypothetical protein GBAR_LOCUS26423 [Geodia barretti]|uniref:Uncharacterized protein n=1 Tax=Geodia barretti TaxID=519541 RepID=A0AA35TGV4_GEOBA|nr:hypothetical protein GBAR_LOCUS26423 [Geodia barretti]
MWSSRRCSFGVTVAFGYVTLIPTACVTC